MTDPTTRTADEPAARPDETRVLGAAGGVALPPSPADRYELRAEIARGGMGAVFAARDRFLNREVAVKVLRAEFIDRPGTAARFVEEAQIAGQLQHPGVPPVHDLGALPDGRPFIAMKLIKGRTLADLLAADPPEPPRLLQIFEQVCQTIAYAHSHHVIHRDLKPHNVMVGAFGEVQVMDWGLAKVLGEPPAARPAPAAEPAPFATSVIETGRDQGSLTQAGSLLGTPPYMPPEQAKGDIAGTDRRADVFALGALLCELLTGRPPYVGSPDEVKALAVIAHLQPAHDRLARCGADPELVELARRCLSADPAERPADAAEVLDAVAAHRAGVENRLRRTELERAAAEARAAEQVKRRRVQAALGLAITAAVVLVGFGLWWQDRQAEARRAEAALRDVAAQAELDRRREATDRDAAAALDSMRGLVVEARRQEDDPERMRLTLTAARSHLGRAEAALASGSPTEETRRRVADAAGELAQADKDARLMAALENARREPARPGVPGFPGPGAAGSYAAAFREYGLDVLGAPPDAVAAHVQRHPYRTRLVIALNGWASAATDRAQKERILEVMWKVAPEPGTGLARVHAAVRKGDLPQLIALARAPDTLGWQPVEIELLATVLFATIKGQDAGLALLRSAVGRYPGDFSLNYRLGMELRDTARPDLAGAVRYLTAAASLRPRDAHAAFDLAAALAEAGDDEAAVRWYERALAVNPNIPWAYNNIAAALGRLRRYDDAAAAARKSIDLDPRIPAPYGILARALRVSRPPEERLNVWRGLSSQYPRIWMTSLYLGVALAEAGHPDEAESAYRAAVTGAGAGQLGFVGELLLDQGQAAAAVEVLQRAADLAPRDPAARAELSRALRAAERVEDAAREFRAAARLDPSSAEVHDGLCAALSACGRPGEAARLAAEQLRRHPDWAPQLRYNAACAAALAGTGRGQDAPPPADRPALRRQALDWLRAELAALRLTAAADQARAHRLAADWLTDPDLGLVRHPIALYYLPAGERDEWARLWADVRALRDATAPRPRG